MRWSFILVVATACGGGEPAVAIEGGPVLLVAEGSEVRAEVRVLDAPQDGDCAPPFEPSDFTVRAGPAAEALFDVLEIGGAQGSVHLAIEPRCDAVASGAGDAVITATVASAAECAAPAEVRLQIADTVGEACAPRVAAWRGDCGTKPADASTIVVIPSEPSPGPLCVEFEGRDPATESLFVKTDTTAPGSMIDADELPATDVPFSGTRTFSIALGSTMYIRGEFALSYEILEGDNPGSGVLIGYGDIDLVVGEPGLSINAPADGMLTADEFGVTTMPLRVFRLLDGDGEPAGAVCARAERDPIPGEQSRAKPFLRFTEFSSGISGGSGDWVCGSGFRLAVSPPIDAPPVETVRISAGICGGCTPLSPEPIPPAAPLVTRDVTFDVASMADVGVCPGGMSDDLVVACADITGDNTPELVFRSANGADDRACAFLGEERRLVSADWDGASASIVPVWMSALRWHAPNAGGPRPLIVGQLPAAGGIRVLQMTTDDPPVAAWQTLSALGLGNIDVPLRAATVLARDTTMGATHIAYPTGGRDVRIRCITLGDSVIDDCSNTLIQGVAPVGNTIDHLARGDLDGDGDMDLVAFTVDGSSPGVLTMVAVGLEWLTDGVVVEDGIANITTVEQYTGNHFRTGAVDRVNCMTPPVCREAIYAAVTDPLEDVAHLIRIRLNGMANFIVDTIPTLNAVFDVTSLDDRLIAGMQFGIGEALAANSLFVDWLTQDPVIQEYFLADVPITPPDGYGLSVAVCRASYDAIAYTTSASTAVVTSLDVDVQLP